LESSKWTNVNISFSLDELIFSSCFSSSSTAASQRSQTQVADRRQIDDMDGNNARSNATSSSITVPRGATTGGSTDELGPLPPGWQMSRTDTDRAFFIDHINKRTTWVKEEKNNRKFSTSLICLFC